MVPLITRLWNWDSRLKDFPKITWEACSRARNWTKLPQNTAQGVPHMTNPPILFLLCFPQHPSLLTNYYSSWQTLDVCYAQHWAPTGYRNIRSSYQLGSSWGKKGQFFLQTVYGALHAESILTVLFGKQSVASLQRRNCWSNATNRQSHSIGFFLY